jgi:hypothetical protein
VRCSGVASGEALERFALTPTPADAVRAEWHRFLEDLTTIRHSYRMSVVPVPVYRDPRVEAALARSAFIQLCSLLDEALALYIHERGVPKATRERGWKDDLFHRTKALEEGGRLADAAAVHALRGRRKGLAHTLAASVTWAEVDEALAAAERELQRLWAVGPRPTVAFSFGVTPRP